LNLLVTGTGRSGTKAIQLYLALALLRRHPEIHLNYEPYLWKTRKGRFSFEGLAHHHKDPMFPVSEGELGGGHRRYFERLSQQAKSPVVTKCIRGLGRISVLRKALQAEVWIHVVRDLYEVLESLERQEWNLYEIGPPVFPYKKIDLWPQVLQGLEVLELPSGIKSQLSQAKTEIEKNAVCWYLDNLAVLSAKKGPDLVVPFEHLKESKARLLESLDMQASGMPVSFHDIRGHQLRNDDWLVEADSHTAHWDDLKHSWNEKVFREGFPNKLLLAETIGQSVNLRKEQTSHTVTSRYRPAKTSLPRTDFLDQLNEDILARIDELMN
jgi:hypothetical protein